MDSLRCGTCLVQFNKRELHREHFKSDWHLYNIKRKVIKLEPITVDDFIQRQQLTAAGSCASSEFGETHWYCAYCSKKFASKRAWQNHCESRQHARKESDHVEQGLKKVQTLNKKAEEKGEVKPTKNDINEILRSPVRARRHITTWSQGDSPRNQWLKKMDLIDSMDDEIIEETESDVNGWSDVDSTYSIGSSVQAGGEQRDIELDECLFCGINSGSFNDNIIHMKDMHDFRLPDAEYVISPEELVHYLADKIGNGNICLVCNNAGRAFYSLQAVRNHMLTKGHCYVSVTGTNALDYVDFYDFTQCVNELSIMCNELTTANEESGDGGYELVLPSGAVLGHRHIATYFRQRPTSKIVPKARLNKAPMYRAITYGNETQVAADLRKVWKYKNKFSMQNGVRNNKVTMEHFKDRNGFCI